MLKSRSTVFILFLSLLLSCIVSTNAYALNDGVTIYVSFSGSNEQSLLTINDGFLSPGENIVKEFNIKNNCSYKIYISGISIENLTVRNSKGDILDSTSQEYQGFIKHISLKLESSDNTLFNNSFENLISTEELLFNPDNKFMSGELKYMKITVSMDNDADDYVKNLTGNFDIKMRFAQILSGDGGSGGNGGDSSGGSGNGNGGGSGTNIPGDNSDIGQSNNDNSSGISKEPSEVPLRESDNNDLMEPDETTTNTGFISDNSGMLPMTGGKVDSQTFLQLGMFMIVLGAKILNRKE